MFDESLHIDRFAPVLCSLHFFCSSSSLDPIVTGLHSAAHSVSFVSGRRSFLFFVGMKLQPVNMYWSVLSA